MLLSVHIENIALIKKADISFPSGFIAFTGETGAGKSIVVDSIGMVCGAKVSKEVIRSGESEGKAEAMFSELSERQLCELSELGIFPDEDGVIFVSRTLQTDGKNTVRLNGRQIPLSLLREAAAKIINIHGQHDNADLLRPEMHIDILDSFAGNEKELTEYKNEYSRYLAIKKQIDDLSIDEKEKKRRIDILKFQIDEIRSAKLKDGEEEKLTAEKNKLKYSEKINRNASLCYRMLYEGASGGFSAVESIDKAKNSVDSLIGIIDGAELLSERLENAKYELIDIAETVSDYAGDMDDDPVKALDRIESRLDVISKLCSRYGKDIKEVLSFCESCEKSLSDIELSDENIVKLKKELCDCQKSLSQKADTLTDSRKKAALRLSRSIENELRYLDMNGASFRVDFDKDPEFMPNGAEKAYFMIKTNSGENYNSLARSASGGELSRIMLAIKSVLSEKDGVCTMIFDEIDTGISGSTSRKIGIKLKKLAEKRQVICVTHSAQVASLSDCHIKISKHVENGRTETSVKELSYDERVNEIARIISGMDVSKASLDSARELIDNIDE